MKHSTFRKSSLISSVALLLVAIVALSGATFAWFSSQSTAKATGVATSAKAASGLLLTTTPDVDSSWTYNLPLSNKVKDLTPVSSNFDVIATPSWFTTTAGDAASYEKADNETFKPVQTENLGDYVDMYTVYAKTQNGDAADVNVKATVVETIGKFGRVAIVSGSTILYYKDGVEVKDVEGVPTEVDSETWNPIDKDAKVAETKGFTATSNIDAKIGTIPAGEILAITIYVWNEGQDPGCTTNTSAESLTATFDFSII